MAWYQDNDVYYTKRTDPYVLPTGTWTCVPTQPLAEGMILNIGSGRCLSASKDSPVTIYDCNSSVHQLFALYPDNTLRVYDESACLDISGSMVTIRNCDNRDSQKWALSQVNGQLVTYNGKCANVKGGKQSKGAQLEISACKISKQSSVFKLIPSGTVVEQCFGGVGSKCEGVLLAAPAGKRKPDGTQILYVSVGSIAHDNCCLKSPDGWSCQDLELGTDWNRNCMGEWIKAVNSSGIPRRHWKAKNPPFGPYSLNNYSDDLNPDSDSQRYCYIPTKTGSEKKDLQETVSSRRLFAPRGTKLDRRDDVMFCQSGEANYPEGRDYMICK